jgi:hypothetical protein
MRSCTICAYLGLEPRQVNGAIGLNTAIPELIKAAPERLDRGGTNSAHVLLPVCPEHVVEIYRERIPGVAMAWRLGVKGA